MEYESFFQFFSEWLQGAGCLISGLAAGLGPGGDQSRGWPCVIRNANLWWRDQVSRIRWWTKIRKARTIARQTMGDLLSRLWKPTWWWGEGGGISYQEWGSSNCFTGSRWADEREPLPMATLAWMIEPHSRKAHPFLKTRRLWDSDEMIFRPLS